MGAKAITRPGEKMRILQFKEQHIADSLDGCPLKGQQQASNISDAASSTLAKIILTARLGRTTTTFLVHNTSILDAVTNAACYRQPG